MNRARIYHRAQQLLPSALETAGMPCFAMPPVQLGSTRCESQGAVVLALSAHAADAIQREGLAYFDEATVARGALSWGGPAHYDAWRRSPSPETWCGVDIAPGTWPRNVDVDDRMRRRLSMARRDSAYHTRRSTGGAWLWVLPDERLVVYRWRD